MDGGRQPGYTNPSYSEKFQPSDFHHGGSHPNENLQHNRQHQQPEVVVDVGSEHALLTSQACTEVFAIHQPHGISFIPAVVLSCITLWCFGLIAGLIAFLIAVMGQTAASAGNLRRARTYRNASMAISIVAIVIGIIVIVIVVSVCVTAYYKQVEEMKYIQDKHNKFFKTFSPPPLNFHNTFLPPRVTLKPIIPEVPDFDIFNKPYNLPDFEKSLVKRAISQPEISEAPESHPPVQSTPKDSKVSELPMFKKGVTCLYLPPPDFAPADSKFKRSVIYPEIYGSPAKETPPAAAPQDPKLSNEAL